MTARRHPGTIPGDTQYTDIRDKILIWIRPGKTLKFHFPEGYDMGATSTTDLEPLSHHGAPPRARRIAAAHVALPRASRHFSVGRLDANGGQRGGQRVHHISCTFDMMRAAFGPVIPATSWIPGMLACAEKTPSDFAREVPEGTRYVVKSVTAKPRNLPPISV